MLPPQPIANFNRNKRREFWNVQARLVRKLEGEEIGVEVDDGCRYSIVQSGAAGCEKGFVKCFPRVPQAAGLCCSCRAA